MIEIRIPKEIKNYREKLFFGLTLRQCICAGAALLICVPLYIFGNRFLTQEAVSWAVVIIAAPLMMAGFFRYNDMNFEQFAVEFLAQQFQPQKRIYEYEPIFMELRREYLLEELALEIEQNIKPKDYISIMKEAHAWIPDDTIAPESSADGSAGSAEESQESCAR